MKKIIEKHSDMPMFPGRTENLTPEDLTISLEWVNKHYRFLRIKPEHRTLDIILSQITEHFQGVILDPWNEFEHSRSIGMTETEYIGQSLMKIKAFAVFKNVHIWLVAHPRKMERDKDGKYPVPTPYDIAGSANFRNKPDNCITVHRDDAQKHGASIHVQKIRFKDNGAPGKIFLKYNPVTGQFSE